MNYLRLLDIYPEFHIMLSAQYKRYFYILCSTSTIVIGWKRTCVFGPRSGFVHVSTPDGQILTSKLSHWQSWEAEQPNYFVMVLCFVPYISLWREHLCLPSDYYEQHIKSTESQWAYEVKKTGSGWLHKRLRLVLKVTHLIFFFKTGLNF